MNVPKVITRSIRFILLLCLWVVFIFPCSACQNQSTTNVNIYPDPVIPYPSETLPSISSPTVFPSQKSILPEMETPKPTQSPPQVQTEAERPLKICSPLADTQIENLSDLIVNPYNPPQPGSDAPHQGIDLAILSPGSGIALSGKPVHAVLDGNVAGVINQRFPYGNAIIIETPLSLLPQAWLLALDFPKMQPTLSVIPALTCPEAGLQPSWDTGSRSVYLMYAHLLEPPQLEVGDIIHCGNSLGEIGDSGNAINPHLHLEMRIGPGKAQFPSMAHYDNSATPLEMQSYCLWRVSGLFQVVDPGRLFEIIP